MMEDNQKCRQALFLGSAEVKKVEIKIATKRIRKSNMDNEILFQINFLFLIFLIFFLKFKSFFARHH